MSWLLEMIYLEGRQDDIKILTEENQIEASSFAYKSEWNEVKNRAQLEIKQETVRTHD